MNCPNCGNEKSLVIETRRRNLFSRRRRECSECTHRWTTAEIDIGELERLQDIEQRYDTLRTSLKENL